MSEINDSYNSVLIIDRKNVSVITQFGLTVSSFEFAFTDLHHSV